MTFLDRRHLGAYGLVILTSAATLTGTGTTSCSGAPAATPDAFVFAQVGPGNGDPGVCGFGSDQSFVEIGAPLSGKPTVFTDGDSENGVPVHISCSVDSNNGGYDIRLSAVLAGGTNGGSMSAFGHITAAGGSGVEGSFTTAGNSAFRDTNCSISFTYVGAPVPASGNPIAQGRIWGHIECPNASVSGQSGMAPDGAAVTRTCDGHADFLFENCD